MAVVSSIIAAVGVAASVAGTAVGVMASQQQAQAQKKAIAAQQQAEAARKKQMDLDAQRKRREIVKEQIKARSQALATTSAQGANGEGSSALGGVEGQLSQQAGSATLAVNQNQEIGADIFAANAAGFRAQSQAASAGAMAGFGNGLSSFGGAITNNAKTIARIGGYT